MEVNEELYAAHARLVQDILRSVNGTFDLVWEETGINIGKLSLVMRYDGIFDDDELEAIQNVWPHLNAIKLKGLSLQVTESLKKAS